MALPGENMVVEQPARNPKKLPYDWRINNNLVKIRAELPEVVYHLNHRGECRKCGKAVLDRSETCVVGTKERRAFLRQCRSGGKLLKAILRKCTKQEREAITGFIDFAISDFA